MSREDMPQSLTAMLADYMARIVPANASAQTREIISNAYLAGASGAFALIAMRDPIDAAALEILMEEFASELESLVMPENEKH